MRPEQRNLLSGGLALVLSLGGAVCLLAWWFTYEAAPGLHARLPGGDRAPAKSAASEERVNLEGTFETFDGVAVDLPGAWPRFRGTDFDNICKDGTPLADAWPGSGPPALWRVELGEGYAGPVVLGGRVYVLDYDEKAKADAARCFSLADGREIWRRSYAVDVKRNHGMSRTVPAVTDKYLVTIGPRCHVVCLDPVTGAFKWGIDLQREYGTTEPLWYTGQCPLIEEGRLILAPGGPEVLMMAVDCETGTPVWKTPNPYQWLMSHASVTPMTLAGRRMYVYCAVGGVSGVSAEGADAGALLWQLPWNAKVVAPSPVPIGGDRIFLTAGYSEGGMMVQVRRNGDAFEAKVLYKHGPKDGLACEQQTPICHDGLLYGIMPKDAGGLRAQFVCYNLDGTLVWSSGPEHRFGLGPFLLADGKFFVLGDEGELTMLRASRTGFEPLGRAQVLHGHDAWGPIALVNGRMLLRDMTQMVCIAAAKGA